jgi:hypothetical protein
VCHELKKLKNCPTGKHPINSKIVNNIETLCSIFVATRCISMRKYCSALNRIPEPSVR